MVSLEVQNISFRIQSLGLGVLESLDETQIYVGVEKKTKMWLKVRDDGTWGLLIDLPSYQGDLDGIKSGPGWSALE